MTVCMDCLQQCLLKEHSVPFITNNKVEHSVPSELKTPLINKWCLRDLFSRE